jgi:hypothetical protein
MRFRLIGAQKAQHPVSLLRVCVAQLMRRKAAPDPGPGGDSAGLGADRRPDHGRPRVGPSMTQTSGPTGSSARVFSQGRSRSQRHSSTPTSRRRPPLPLRTSTDPRHADRHVGAGQRGDGRSAAWCLTESHGEGSPAG